MRPASDRALSTPSKLLLYGALGLVGLFTLTVVVSLLQGIVWGIIGLFMGVLSFAVTIGVVAAIAYAVYWLASSVFGESDASDKTTATQKPVSQEPTDPVERINERYANGELSEAELERKLEQVLDEPAVSTGADSGYEREREYN